MRHLAALTAFGLLVSTAAYAQNAPQAEPAQNAPQAHSQNEAAETHGAQQALAEPFVRQIQMRLHAHGVYQGNPTGTWDEETSKAVKDFQQAQNIQPTGQIDGRTIAALMRQPEATEGEGTEGEGSSAPATRMSPGSMLGMRMPTVRSFERGYQQGFEEGVRWSQQQQEQEQQ